MGWLADSVSGVPVVSHDGDSLNMQSDMILVPSLDWAVEVVADSDSLPILLTASVTSTAKGVVSMLLGSMAPFTVSPLATYADFDLLVLALVGLQLWSLVRAIRQSRESARLGWASALRRAVLPFGWRLVVAMGVLGLVWLLAAQIGAFLLLIANTDLGVSMVAIAVLLVVNGALRAARVHLAAKSSDKPTAPLAPATNCGRMRRPEVIEHESAHSTVRVAQGPSAKKIAADCQTAAMLARSVCLSRASRGGSNPPAV
jgi:hypothetical protein